MVEFYEARNKLRRMGEADLFELASKQGISRCVIGSGACGLYFRYEGFGFCVSEILGQSCQVQRSKTLENCHKDLKEIDSPPPLVENPDRNRYGIESTLIYSVTNLEPSCPRDRKFFMNLRQGSDEKGRTTMMIRSTGSLLKRGCTGIVNRNPTLGKRKL